MNFKEWVDELSKRCAEHVRRVSTPEPKQTGSPWEAMLASQPPAIAKVAIEAAAAVRAERLKKIPRVYLAGRITKNDWRHELAPQIDDIIHPSEWTLIKELPMRDGNIYVGPFFMGCDHGCTHGTNKHGATDAYGCGGDPPIKQNSIFCKAIAGIKACDVFFVYAGPDFGAAYGTLVEIGIARTLGKRIVIACHSGMPKDQWFGLECATETFVCEDPIAGYKRAMHGVPASGDKSF